MCTTNTTMRLYSKSFIPLESDPSVLGDLMYSLGVSNSLTLVDVASIDEPSLISFMPRPAFALTLVLPTSERYEQHRQLTREIVEVEEDSKPESAIWFRQTIDSACGLYAILHATCDLETRKFISMLSIPRKGTIPLI